MKIIIKRKKQFASALVPFYIIINMDQDEIMEKINIGEEINAIPIKKGETIIFNINEPVVKVICMNSNIESSSVYPLRFTKQLIISNDSTLFLEQTKWFKTVEIKLSINNKITVDEKKSHLYKKYFIN